MKYISRKWLLRTLSIICLSNAMLFSVLILLKTGYGVTIFISSHMPLEVHYGRYDANNLQAGELTFMFIGGSLVEWPTSEVAVSPRFGIDWNKSKKLLRRPAFLKVGVSYWFIATAMILFALLFIKMAAPAKTFNGKNAFNVVTISAPTNPATNAPSAAQLFVRPRVANLHSDKA